MAVGVIIIFYFVVVYLCVIDVSSFYDFSIGFVNCFDSVILLCFSLYLSHWKSKYLEISTKCIICAMSRDTF